MTTSPLTVTVLGCNGTFAGAAGACTGFLVRSGTASVWLDAGPGTLANLQRHIALEDLTAVVLSHEHPDHWLEIPVVCNALRFTGTGRPVPVYSTAGTLQHAQPLCRDLDEVFEWRVVADGDEATIGDQAWRWSRTHHYVETLACRVEAGRAAFVFSADTGPGWQAEQLGPGPDLAVVESTFLAAREPSGMLHLSARQAGEKAASLGARRLVLTHLLPGQDPDAHMREAEASFRGPVDVAGIGDVYET